jgi:CBS domain-containing protein
MNATVKDVMTTHVVAVRLNATYKEMAARLREFRVSAFPVVDDDNKVVGVVSEADLLTKEGSRRADSHHLATMTPPDAAVQDEHSGAAPAGVGPRHGAAA